MLTGRITTNSVTTSDDIDRVNDMVHDHIGGRAKEIQDDIFEVAIEEDEVIVYYYLRDGQGEVYTRESDKGLAFETVVTRRREEYDYIALEDLIDKEPRWEGDEEEDHLS